MPRITPNLWFDDQALEAAEFYVSIFPNSRITDVLHYTAAGPGPEGTVLSVNFELDGQPFTGINGGPVFPFTEAVSLLIDCKDQAEIDHYWSVLTANGGAEITKLVGTSAWYAPGAAAAEMVEIILKDTKKIVPCSVFLQGEYGIKDLFVGVPVKLGARGVEQIIEIKLTAEEEAALKKSAGAVKELTDVIGV